MCILKELTWDHGLNLMSIDLYICMKSLSMHPHMEEVSACTQQMNRIV
jgi:hypothetical protein